MKTMMFCMLFIIIVQSLHAQDTVTLKNGKVAAGKIINMDNGIIKLLMAKDTVKYTANEVATLMFCSIIKNCTNGDKNSNAASSTVTRGNTKDDPCDDINKQNESTGKLKSKPAKSRNYMY